MTSYTCTVEGKQRTFPAEQVYIINNEEDMNMSVDDLVHLDQSTILQFYILLVYVSQTINLYKLRYELF